MSRYQPIIYQPHIHRASLTFGALKLQNLSAFFINFAVIVVLSLMRDEDKNMTSRIFLLYWSKNGCCRNHFNYSYKNRPVSKWIHKMTVAYDEDYWITFSYFMGYLGFLRWCKNTQKTKHLKTDLHVDHQPTVEAFKHLGRSCARWGTLHGPTVLTHFKS